MKFGPVPPKVLPKQDLTKVLRIGERWQRASSAQRRWAEPAKMSVDFFEGRQWTETELVKMKGRPTAKFNVIAPLVRLVLGYFENNKTDITFKPGSDARSSEEIGEILTRVEKAIATMSKQEFVDTEVFMDGLVAGRGFFDTRLDFEMNDLGELRTKALDPFAVFPDPDADTYDLNDTASYIQQAKWTSLEEISAAFGNRVGELLKPWTLGQTPMAPVSSIIFNEEITPIRTFGQREDNDFQDWDAFYSVLGDCIDTHRKTLRVIETQYKVKHARNVMIDLETGDKRVLPADWGPDKLQKALAYADLVNNPCIIQPRLVELLHFTVTAGDLILYDRESDYDDYTITGYFPYFRRGMTRGMVEDLIDPQVEKNKRRNAEIEIVSKTANGGWSYHENALDPVQEANLKKFGSKPGVNIKYKGDPAGRPEPIQSVANTVNHEKLERKADDDLRAISGVNESALGETDHVLSGRAIEARQKQAVVSVQTYMSNFKRSKGLIGDFHLHAIQRHYTEARMYRVLGEDGKFVKVLINELQQDPATGVVRVLNDITIGRYTVAIDDAPLSATFLNAQFEEMMNLMEKLGPALGPKLPFFADLMIDMSSMPRKQEWIQRFQMVNGMGQPGMPPGAPGAPPGPPGAPPQLPPPGPPAPPPQG